MKYLLKLAIILTAASLVCCKASAQQFATHKVKRGETLTSIAKQYKVTPYNILKFNKELKQGDTLQPNTILVIPLDAKAADTGSEVTTTENTSQVDVEKQIEPQRFTSHKVRRKETLFGIAKRYNISEEDIKRYNTDLYASQLKKGMRLRIPVYPEVVTPEDLFNPDDFETYTVQPKETRWSIAHKYGITVDSLLILNPELPRTTNHLAIGQTLQLPKIAGSSIEEQSVQLYESYTVPPKQTLYSLGKEYGITSQEILKLNPEIVEQGGLKEGMVLRLPKKTIDTEVVNTDNYVFYEVKPKQTEYSITRNLGITYRELLDLNPDLSRGLKAGMVLKLPRDKAVSLEVKNALVLDKINLRDSVNVSNKPSLLFLLPFRLDKIDFANAENAENYIRRSNALKYSLGLYSGSLIALDSIAELGISVDVKTMDTQLSSATTKSLLLRENLSDYQAIVGPLQAGNLKEVAVQAAAHQIPVIAPLAAETDISLNNVFFSIPTEANLRTRILNYIEDQRKEETLIVIADEKNKGVADQILERFPFAQVVEVKEEEKNIGINIDEFTLLLSEQQENWVFVETDNFKLISSVSSILNSSNTADIKVRMFTTDKNKAFDNEVISGNHLSNLNFTYPSAYRETANDAFVNKYRRKFGNTPDRYAVRGFDLTYDVLLKLAYKMNLFEGSETIGVTEYSGNKFNYEKDLASGYFNTASYIMMYDSMRIKEVKPAP